MARLPAGWARKPGGTTIATTVAIRTRSGSTNAWLEVDYQGLEAPTALFADLAQIGWKPPTIAPPPHHAIDWTQPNEATGERFTLRAYAVEGAIVASPGGTGARGTWTDAERVTHLGALGRVLGRHPAVALDDPRGLLAASAGPTPDPPAPVAGPTGRTASAGPAVRFTPSPGAAAVLVTAPVKPSRAPQIEDELIALGATVVFDSQERVKQERYRGSTYDTTVTELHVATIATPDQLDAVVGVLSAHGMTLTFAEVDRATITPDRATDGPGPDDTSTVAPSDATAPVRVVARP